jgi:hypothetical protein
VEQGKVKMSVFLSPEYPEEAAKKAAEKYSLGCQEFTNNCTFHPNGRILQKIATL